MPTSATNRRVKALWSPNPQAWAIEAMLPGPCSRCIAAWIRIRVSSCSGASWNTFWKVRSSLDSEKPVIASRSWTRTFSA